MYAEQGDWLVIKGTAVGRGISDGHFGLVFPGPNAMVQPARITMLRLSKNGSA